MEHYVTLILILHNRHHNIDRLIDYYQDSAFPIIIADSSITKHQYKTYNSLHRHLYSPGVTFTRKIELVLKEVKTPFVVMCADDDFIVPEAIIECVEFLKKHPDYSVAQGTCIKFYKNSIMNSNVDFGLLYPIKSFDIELEEPFERLKMMFDQYRSVLYAVHRTELLQKAFNGASSIITNLYLNEYLTAVVPIFGGKYKELACLYQIREFAEDSDDKITDNIDIIFSVKKYKQERESFLNLLAQNASTILNEDINRIFKKVSNVLEQFAKSPQVAKKDQNVSVKKRIGQTLQNIPIVGKWLIERNRKFERARDLKKLLSTPEDQKQLHKVESYLKKYAYGIS